MTCEPRMTCDLQNPHFSATDGYERLRRLSIFATAATLRCSAQILCRCSFCTDGKQATLAWKKGGIPGAVKHEFVSGPLLCLGKHHLSLADQAGCPRAELQMCFLHQLSQADDGPAVSKVSMLCIAIQALTDAYDSFLHLCLGLSSQYLFNSMSMVALFKFLLCSLLEARYLLIILRHRRHEAFSEGWESVRREVSWLYTRFYSALVVGSLMVYNCLAYLDVVVLVLQLYWVPQIAFDAWQGSRNTLKPTFITSISASRLLLPLYLWGCPKTIFTGEIYPRLPGAQSLRWCLLLVGLQAIQVGILLLQKRLGNRSGLRMRDLHGRSQSRGRAACGDPLQSQLPSGLFGAVDGCQDGVPHWSDLGARPAEQFFHLFSEGKCAKKFATYPEESIRQGSKNSGSRKFSAAATCLLFGRFTEEKMLQCTASACSLEDNTTNRKRTFQADVSETEVRQKLQLKLTGSSDANETCGVRPPGRIRKGTGLLCGRLTDAELSKRRRRRRWVWAKREMARSAGFFSEEEMKERDPQLYHRLVGQYVDTTVKLSDPMQGTLSTYLMQQLERECEAEVLHVGHHRGDESMPAPAKRQKLIGDGEADDFTNEDYYDVSDTEAGSDDFAVRRAKFLKAMRDRFVDGLERNFDYAALDENSDLDDVVELGRDAEEKYFDAE
ncbi:unnamed protein product [Cladocopium goreaui]|uniref:RING-type E3 ubiquitin transferase n=1 Tax=Cladocopium goreaui TaxID=2562237 RepID=A0A9P1CYS4_9DINO|nr:unnamed protein product [Cladocopium goreaui]